MIDYKTLMTDYKTLIKIVEKYDEEASRVFYKLKKLT